MKFNKRKFFRNFFFLILFVALVLTGVYLLITSGTLTNSSINNSNTYTFSKSFSNAYFVWIWLYQKKTKRSIVEL